MLPRILSIAIPLCVYTALALVVWGIIRERAKFDRWVAILALAAFALSLAVRPSEHLLFFDEDIYIQIASNLTHAPSAQLTLFGGPGEIQASAYYKEPVGLPVLLSLVFLVTGVREAAAFIFVRILYAMTVAAVYLLGRAILKTRHQAITAAIVFAATPVCLAYSATTGTDLTAAMFAALGVLGIATGNGMLAAGALAMTSLVRLEMIAIAPLILFTKDVPAKWKATLAGLLAPEVIHIGWVFSIAPILVKIEHVQKSFSTEYVFNNLAANLRYLFDPRMFPLAAIVLALAALLRKAPMKTILLLWLSALFAVYLCFFAGSFDINPRYSIQITIPIVLLAASVFERKAILLLMVLTAVVAVSRPWQPPLYVQALASDHETAVQFGETVGPRDLVVTGEPEMFLNQGKHAMNALYSMEHPDVLRTQFGKYNRILYYAGIRTNELGSTQWEADQKVKSDYELHLIRAKEVSGFRIAIYELLQPIHREAGKVE